MKKTLSFLSFLMDPFYWALVIALGSMVYTVYTLHQVSNISRQILAELQEAKGVISALAEKQEVVVPPQSEAEEAPETTPGEIGGSEASDKVIDLILKNLVGKFSLDLISDDPNQDRLAWTSCDETPTLWNWQLEGTAQGAQIIVRPCGNTHGLSEDLDEKQWLGFVYISLPEGSINKVYTAEDLIYAVQTHGIVERIDQEWLGLALKINPKDLPVNQFLGNFEK